MAAICASDARKSPSLRNHTVAALYIAPVSTYVYHNVVATHLAVVHFPVHAPPSIAIVIFFIGEDTENKHTFTLHSSLPLHESVR